MAITKEKFETAKSSYEEYLASKRNKKLEENPLLSTLRTRKKLVVYIDNNSYFIETSAAFSLGFINNISSSTDLSLYKLTSQQYNWILNDPTIEIEYRKRNKSNIDNLDNINLSLIRGEINILVNNKNDKFISLEIANLINYIGPKYEINGNTFVKVSEELINKISKITKVNITTNINKFSSNSDNNTNKHLTIILYRDNDELYITMGAAFACGYIEVEEFQTTDKEYFGPLSPIMIAMIEKNYEIIYEDIEKNNSK